MSRMLHCCQSVRGAMRLSKRDLAKMFKRDDGSPVSADDAWEHLADELARGREVIPLGEPCEGFDYVDGCPGHETDSVTQKDQANA